MDQQPRPTRHVPVLPAEVLTVLDPKEGQTIVDATIGVGGHAGLFLERLGASGVLIGLDLDPSMLETAALRLRPKSPNVAVKLVNSGFEDLRQVLNDLGVTTVDVVLADLGVCSDQLDDPQRGFSFLQEGPLDMRLDSTLGEPASALLNRASDRDLADIFWRYGEERFSRRIARRIVETRTQAPLRTTTQLADLVRRCVPRGKGRIDPATRVFQALRIAVNEELDALERFVQVLPNCLKSGGRAAIISFHSLEDRIVKNAFKDQSKWTALTRKPLTCGDEEGQINPRARSAKLRAAVRLM